MSKLLAHLDKKTGQRILCGSCGNEIARIRVRAAERFVAFPPGWKVNSADGAWTLTRHAREAIKWGRPPSYRRAHRPRVGLPLEGRESRDDLIYLERRMRRPARGILVDQFPVQAACPRCDARSWLTTERLRVKPYPRVVGRIISVKGAPYVHKSEREFPPEPGALYTDL